MEIFTQGKTNQPVQQIVQIEPNPVFDDYRQFSPEGREFWSARNLQRVLGYSTWQKFEVVVLKVCGNLESEGLGGVNQTVKTSKQNKKIVDYELSRFACYKIAMRGETEECVKAQTYFAVQTRKQEILKERKPIPQIEINAAFLFQMAESMKKLEEVSQAQKIQIEAQAKELEHKQKVVVERAAQVPAKTMRSMINEVCRNTENRDFETRWGNLYKEFFYHYKVNLKSRAKNRNMKVLDYAEQWNFLEDLYNLALKLYETEPATNQLVAQ